jgi:demethylmenaquinone methyltransferase / 2-methoxy-6-polyprenyl-1,4-benzoquinol methylase
MNHKTIERYLMSSVKNTTHFGNRTVKKSEKAALVNDVFTNVANKYDIMNDTMSLGIHRIWKHAMLDWLSPRNNQHLLDVAGGTGDIAFRFINRAPLSKVTVLDMTENMLIEGKKRAEAQEYKNNINWVCGDAMNLPFEDSSFDAYTISFGIRNVTDIQKALSEAYRVLKPGGRLLVLEFSQIPISKLQKLYDLYSFKVIPTMGKLIVNDSDSYKYLVESIRKFPKQEEFLKMIEMTGFENTKYRNLSLGIAALHSGWKI